jgi:SAM-dependent methyltransferase
MSAEDYEGFYANEYWQLNSPGLPDVSSKQEELARDICDFVKSHSPGGPGTGQKILDIGCGTGETLHALSAGTDSTGYGIEPSASTAQWAREKYGHTIIQRDFLHNELPDREFDLVIASAVLEHFLDPLTTLKEMKRLIKRTGILFVRVPNLEELNFRRRGAGFVFKLVHTCYFTPRGLEVLLRKAGFDVFASRTIHIKPGQAQGEYWVLCAEAQERTASEPEDYRRIIAAVRSARIRDALPRMMSTSLRVSKRVGRSSIRILLRKTSS